MTKLNELLPLNLQFFADGGEPDGTEGNTPDPTPAPEKTITQSEVDKIVADRLARERAKYADYDELKKKAADFEAERKRIEDEKLSEAERLQKALDEAKVSEQAAATQLADMKAQAERDRIKAAFMRKAADAGIKYTDAAVKLSDLSALQFDEKGELVGVDDAINALITDNPFLVVDETRNPKQIGGGSDGGDERVEKTTEQRLEEARVKAVKSGLPKDRAAYAKLKRELNK